MASGSGSALRSARRHASRRNTGVAWTSPAGSGRGRIVTSAASVCSAGTVSWSAGQLLNVITGATGCIDCWLSVAPNATDAAPRRSTIHIVSLGTPTDARLVAASRARCTTASPSTSGIVAVTGASAR